jgi:hypothetical protein
MSSSRDPVRLRTLARTDSPLGEALDSARARTPTKDQLNELSRALAPLFVPPLAHPASPSVPSPHPSGAPLPPASLGMVAVKTAAVLVAVGVAGGVGWWQQGRTSSEVELGSARSAQSARSQRATPDPSAAPSARSPVTATQDLPQTRVGARPTTLQARASPSSRHSAGEQAAMRGAAAPDSSAEDGAEVVLIDRARQAIASDPSRSLLLVEEHRRRFPRGAMGEEREVIGIAALVGLGRKAQARELGEAFLRAHPGSAYARRVNALLAQAAPGASSSADAQL